MPSRTCWSPWWAPVTDEYCEDCDMTKAFCIHGNPPAKIEFDRLVATGPTIEAQYNVTDCAGCGHRITQGRMITMTSEGWAHAEEVDPPQPDNTFEGIV
jgi:hypothetical protein